MFQQIKTKLFWLVALSICLAACTADIEPIEVTRVVETAVPSPSTPAPPQLDGTEWELVAINDSPPIPNSRITLAFSDGIAGGYGGCNSYGGPYTFTADGTISIPEIASNTADCSQPEGVTAQERAYLQSLGQVSNFALTGSRLILIMADGSHMTYSPVPQFNMNPADLIDTAWQLVSWGQRELLPDTDITLIFESTGRMSGFAGCRHYTGSYSADNDDIRFPILSMAEESCALGDDYLIQEGDFTTALSETTQYRWQEGQLELFTNPGEVLTFVPLAAAEAQSEQVVPVPTAVPEPAVSPIALGAAQMLGRGQIVDAAFTPDGTSVAVAWANGVSFTAVADAQEQWWQPMGSAPLALDMRPDGQAIAAITSNGFLLVMSVADAHFQTYPIARANAYWGDVAWSPDGHQIALSFIGPNRADPIYIFDTTTEITSEVPQSPGNSGTHPYLVWSPDGRAITLASIMETCAHILDVQTGERLFKLQHEDGCYSPYALAWSPDGHFLTLSSPHNNTIDTIEFTSQTVSQSVPGTVPFQPTRAGQSLFYSPDGRWLASKGGFGFYGDTYPLQVWEAATGQQLGESDLFTPRHRLVSSFAGETLVSLYEDGTLTRWLFGDGVAEEIMGQLPVYVVRSPYSWSPDGRKIATPTDTQFVIWDVLSGQSDATFDLNYPAAAFSPDSRLVALADWQTEQMMVYDLDNQTITQSFAGAMARGEGVAFSPDGRSLAYGSGNEVIVAEVATGEQTAVLTGYPAEQAITKIIWSPTGTALVAASGVVAGEEAPGTVIVWGQTAVGAYHELFRAENVRAAYTINTRPVALFNPGGTLVALENLPRAEAGQFTIFVYDLEQEAVILEMDEHQLSGWESEEILLTAEAQYDTRLTQWDVRTGASTLGQARDNGGLTFAPTGGYYAQMDVTAPNIARGVEVRHWQSNLVLAQAPLGSDVIQISWSPDGRFLAASASDGTLTVWPVLRSDN